ncbi:hypothetical protein ASPFODRAFT_567793 [Aspergillus luchuensis CBS 106.47]|uniref:Uncharacterized protein n=1 Tax=Aspergillus luchuensis (strain CBS 106.47) TaxID=1137211 RepID=A0A1M3TKT8_ASPLC|nr:hypothetical protein ASPFODRAFT_567793 [Aspergillus luchuensis CBS 106.47]
MTHSTDRFRKGKAMKGGENNGLPSLFRCSMMVTRSQTRNSAHSVCGLPEKSAPSAHFASSPDDQNLSQACWDPEFRSPVSGLNMRALSSDIMCVLILASLSTLELSPFTVLAYDRGPFRQATNFQPN